MNNYVEYIAFENTFLDTLYELGYNRDNYEVSVNLRYPDIVTGSSDLVKRSTWAITTSVINNMNRSYTKNNFSGVWWSRVAEFGNPLIIQESYTQENNQRKYDSNIRRNIGWIPWPYVDLKYWNKNNVLRDWWTLIIWNINNSDVYEFWEIKLTVNGDLVMNLKPCIADDGTPYFHDTVRNIRVYPAWYGPTSTAMIKTVVMTWNRQELPIYDWIDKTKISNRIIEVNAYDDGYAAKYDEIAISADEDNLEWVEISDYTVDKQTFEYWVADFIELKPRWTLILPRNRQIAALNRPMVKWHRGDLLRIVVR